MMFPISGILLYRYKPSSSHGLGWINESPLRLSIAISSNRYLLVVVIPNRLNYQRSAQIVKVLRTALPLPALVENFGINWAFSILWVTIIVCNNGHFEAERPRVFGH